MARRGIALLCSGLAAIGIAACGQGSEAKRTVDPRAEALRFLPADAQVAILTEPGPAPALDVLLTGAALVPRQISSPIRRLLAEAQMTPSDLAPLMAEDDPDDDVAPPELMIGIPDTERPRPLLVFASEQEDAMDEAFEQRVAQGLVEPAGELHDADLYRGDGAAEAVRDGVLVAAGSIVEVRAAIELRDGDRDQHLDDRAAEDVLEEVPEGAPVHIFVNLEELVAGNSELEAVAAGLPWVAALGDAGAGAALRDAALRLVGFAKLDNGELAESELPARDDPEPFAPTAIFPARGVISATTDELRIGATLGP
jgi:hypothetical protein